LIGSTVIIIIRDASTTTTANSKKVKAKSNQPPLLLLLPLLLSSTTTRHDIPKARRILIINRQCYAVRMHLVPSIIWRITGWSAIAATTMMLLLTTPLRLKMVVTLLM